MKAKFEHPAIRMLRLMRQAEQNDPRLAELVDACRDGKLATVKRLLKSGLSPNEIPPGDIQMDNAVTAALYARKHAVLRLLAAQGADLNFAPMSTPLVFAAGLRHLPLTKALIDGGADVNLPDESGVTPLWSALKGIFLENKGDPVPVVAALLKAGADPQLVPRKHDGSTSKMTPLRYAAYSGSRKLVQMLVDAGAVEPDLNAVLACGAAARANMAELRALVAEGVSMNRRDALDNTPLNRAVEEGSQQVVEYLLKNGADPNLHEGANNMWKSALMLAAAYGRLKMVQTLIAAGADVNYSCRGSVGGPQCTALDYARLGKHKKVVAYLAPLTRPKARTKKTSSKKSKKNNAGK